jgi:hypothetical protein
VPKVYVVTAPDDIRGIYDTWAACEAKVKGVRGARYQSVPSRELAESMLRGEGAALTPGLWAFVDGNHLGGVGVVLVQKGPDDEQETVVEQGGYTVMEVLASAAIPGVSTRGEVNAALQRLRNVLAELTALYLALRVVPEGATVTIVHDYEGVGAWMEGRWKARDETVAAMVNACGALVDRRRLQVRYRHQRGHQSAWAGRDDFAHYNARADALAGEAGDRLW